MNFFADFLILFGRFSENPRKCPFFRHFFASPCRSSGAFSAHILLQSLLRDHAEAQKGGSSRNLGGRAAWGRVCGRAKLGAGTLRCLRLCWRLLLNWSPAERLGRCPKPQQGRCPCTLQGALPLDPFFVPRLERVSAALWDSSVKPGSPRPSPIPQSPHPRYTDSSAAPSAGQYPAACSEYPPPAHSHWQSPAA